MTPAGRFGAGKRDFIYATDEMIAFMQLCPWFFYFGMNM